MGEDVLKPFPQPINIMYENGQWTTHLPAVTRIALQKNPKTTTCADHCTMSPKTHVTKIIAKTNKERIGKISLDLEKKNYLGTHLGCKK
jgi:hypothetical protein